MEKEVAETQRETGSPEVNLDKPNIIIIINYNVNIGTRQSEGSPAIVSETNEEKFKFMMEKLDWFAIHELMSAKDYREKFNEVERIILSKIKDIKWQEERPYLSAKYKYVTKEKDETGEPFQYYTVAEVAKMLNIKRSNVYGYIRSGTLIAEMVNGRTEIRKDYFEEFKAYLIDLEKGHIHRPGDSSTKYYSTKEISKLLKISVSYINYFIRAGKLKAEKIAGRFGVKEEDFKEFESFWNYHKGREAERTEAIAFNNKQKELEADEIEEPLKYYSIKEVSKLLDISVSHIYYYIKMGILKAEKTTGLTEIKKDDFEEFKKFLIQRELTIASKRREKREKKEQKKVEKEELKEAIKIIEGKRS